MRTLGIAFFCVGAFSCAQPGSPPPKTAELNLVSSLEGLTEHGYGLAINTAGTTVSAGDCDGNVCLWDLKSGELRQHWESPPLPKPDLDGTTSCVFGLAMHPDASWIVTTHIDGTLRTWIPGKSDSRVLGSPDQKHKCLKLDASRNCVVTQSGKNEVLFLNPENGEVKIRVAIDATISALGVSPDGEWLAIGSRAEHKPPESLADVLKGFPELLRPAELMMIRLSDRKIVARVTLPGDSRYSEVSALAISGKNRMVLSADGDEAIAAWEWPSMRLLWQHSEKLTLGSVNDIVFSPDERLIATAHRMEIGSLKGKGILRIWSPRDGTLLCERREHFCVMDRVIFTSQGDRILTVGGDRRLLIWELRQSR